MVEISETLETPVAAGESCSSARPLPGLTETASVVCGENSGERIALSTRRKLDDQESGGKLLPGARKSLMRQSAPVVASAKAEAMWRNLARR